MFEKLQSLEQKFLEIGHQLENPQVTSDQQKFKLLMKEYRELEPIVESYRRYQQIEKQIAQNQALLKEQDEELRALAKEELKNLEVEKESLVASLKILLLPRDPNDQKNVIIEIRAGAGGDESSLFAAELFRAYVHYANKRGWQVEVLSISEGNVGGYKEVIARILGDKVYSRLKFESGVHRVQRVPQTEAQGRVHTSTVTVAIIPEQELEEIKLNMSDIKIDVARAQGAGGQSVNRTESAVRVTHIPTGIIVFCQEAKSQQTNRERALQILYSKLVQFEEEKRQREASSQRLAQIGTGDRSERIRTYNFPQSRVTDHRIGFTTHSIQEIMDGDMDIIIEPLILHFQAEALKQQQQV
ncbi:MAG: peptide chain release factor 1 [Bdellovibrionaceae bacterium]|nr:peptide chain release factor 1 [Pseudobdellovibrionaceae bacterium]MDW8190286.1 peptide chain release factor 1 [Pseudobdellovibrionaceae bacterium]